MSQKNADIHQSVLGVTWKNNEGKMIVRKYTFEQGAIREKIALMIVKHGYIISIVEHEDFS